MRVSKHVLLLSAINIMSSSMRTLPFASMPATSPYIELHRNCLAGGNSAYTGALLFHCNPDRQTPPRPWLYQDNALVSLSANDDFISAVLERTMVCYLTFFTRTTYVSDIGFVKGHTQSKLLFVYTVNKFSLC